MVLLALLLIFLATFFDELQSCIDFVHEARELNFALVMRLLYGLFEVGPLVLEFTALEHLLDYVGLEILPLLMQLLHTFSYARLNLLNQLSLVE